MTVLDADDLTITNGGVGDDTFNNVMAARFTVDTVDRRVDETLAFVRQTGQKFSWWVDTLSTPDSLSARIAAAGFPALDPEPVMCADLTELPALEVPDGLVIRRVTNQAELADYATIIAAGWQPPASGVVRFYSLAAAAALDPSCPARFYVGYHQGLAVCTAEVLPAHGVVGVYNVATLAAHRRQGFGGAITLAALHAARSADFTTAGLLTSPAGQSVYERLGFRLAGNYTPDGVRYTEHSIY